jgi:CIC family chloride channel protein
MLGGFIAGVFHVTPAMFVVVGMTATFGAAAHVPIAALVMVAEMTGGYQLLPPAAFAVLLAYLIQSQLATHLKYSSLYEAQVMGRAQSTPKISSLRYGFWAPRRFRRQPRSAISTWSRSSIPEYR